MHSTNPAASEMGCVELHQATAFDFLHGSWRVRHVKLRRRLVGCSDWTEFPGALNVEPILSGLGNFDRNHLCDPAGHYEAHSLRLFRPSTGKWSIHWHDGRFPGAALGPAVVGGFDDAKGAFFGEDAHEGTAIEVRTTYERLDKGRAVWAQAFRSDLHPEWEINWVMHFERTRA
jgi:hypothetical protein